uniref:SUI1 domain-containing protein n=1 Tax=Rhabditophanes sp. KR3021 TaxID=114890 RepID=A0AC35TMU7_9BILA
MDVFWFNGPLTTKTTKLARESEITGCIKLLGKDKYDSLLPPKAKVEIAKMRTDIKNELDVLRVNGEPIFFKDGKSKNSWYPTLKTSTLNQRMFPPVFVSKTFWKNIKNHGCITAADVFNDEKPYDVFPKFDHLVTSFVFKIMEGTDKVIGPIGIAIPTSGMYNYKTERYPLRSLGVIHMTREKDCLWEILGGFEAYCYNIESLLPEVIAAEEVVAEVTEELEDVSLANESEIVEELAKELDDEKLHLSFLSAAKFLLQDNTLLPMDLGFFFQNYVQKCVTDGVKINLKNTSHKNLKNYIKYVNESRKQKLFSVSAAKDVQMLRSVNFNDEELKAFEPTDGKPSLESDEKETTSGYCIQELFVVTKPVKKFFEAVFDPSVKAGCSFLTISQLQKTIMDYAMVNDLQIQNDRVKIDIDLAKFLRIKDDWENKLQTSRSLAVALTKECSQGYSIKDSDGNVELHKGTIPKIDIHAEKRTNKLVTVFRNMKAFNLQNAKFSSALQKRYAGSAGCFEGRKRATGEMVVEVQGDHTKTIRDFLKKDYGIDSKYVNVSTA